MGLDFEALTEATSGAVGGLLSTTILYPLDTCKSKYQAEARTSKYCKGEILSLLPRRQCTHAGRERERERER
ncbi:hypothetical protein KP509_34G030400 [Ceratopteris richardii]|uniref:Peroxisomal adenine nucleotide carrier 1 n=1 Tax=Ceratopteris richardii TaxID=49495 RepID=A0A8T2QK56_CERRI|nr:hypothetical protein KP509_34G030400 [Ceratopteris richardii]